MKNEILITFSRTVNQSDFLDALGAHAEAVGITPSQAFIFDGNWHTDCQGMSKADKGKVKYCGEWRTTKAGVRYLLVTFYSYRHGGQSSTYNSCRDTVALFESGYISPPSLPKPASIKQPEIDYNRRQRTIHRLWRNTITLTAGAAEPARSYLQHRGLGTLIDNQDLPKCLRFHPALSYWDSNNGKPLFLGNYPCLVAAIQMPDNTAVSLHRTYLQPAGKAKALVPNPKKIMPPAQADGLCGAAIRLYPATEQLAVAEGIETALAIRVATGKPVWSCLSTYGMRSLLVPDTVKHTIICADNDTHEAGEKAAKALAAKLYRAGKTVRIITPKIVGNDWLDVLTGKTA